MTKEEYRTKLLETLERIANSLETNTIATCKHYREYRNPTEVIYPSPEEITRLKTDKQE